MLRFITEGGAMKTKRIISIAISAFILMGFGACQNGGDTSGEGSKTEKQEAKSNEDRPGTTGTEKNKSRNTQDDEPGVLKFHVEKSLPFSFEGALYRERTAKVRPIGKQGDGTLNVIFTDADEEELPDWKPIDQAVFKSDARKKLKSILRTWHTLSLNRYPPVMMGKFSYKGSVKLKSGVVFHVVYQPGEPAALVFENGDTLYLGHFRPAGEPAKKKGILTVDL